MRKFFFHSFCAVLFLSLASFVAGDDKKDKDDDYKVIKVQGSIVMKKSGKSLSQGDVFKENTPLTFQTDDAKATVINSDKGRFVLTKSAKGNNLIPAINTIASRSGAILNLIDLQNQFQGKLCVVDQLKLKIGASDFSMNNGNVFFVEYKYKGETIQKKLSNSGDTLIIDKKELYKVDGNPIDQPDDSNVSLFYLKASENKIITISSFQLIFPNTKELNTEVKIILDELKEKDADKKTDEVVSYLNEFYGKVVKSNIKDYLFQQFGIK